MNDYGKLSRFRIIEMIAVRERRAKIKEERNHRLIVMAIAFTVGLLVGMLLWSWISPHLNDKAVAAVIQ
jgi:hypothetical protein